MQFKFLSNEWFKQIQQITSSTPGYPPENLKPLCFNIQVDHTDNSTEMHFKSGHFGPGFDSDATLSLQLERILAYKLFILNDREAGLAGYINGEIKVEGNLADLMSYYTGELTNEQQLFHSKAAEITAI